MRLQYPTNVRVIMMPCTGRVDVIHLLKAIEDGADGVYVAGCLEGDCHYLTGNLKARKRVDLVKKTLEELGIEPERVEMYNLSAAQGPRFAEIAREMTEKIRALGPSPVGQTAKAA
jgi:coenzyme F420-reducing hydrogenase delta subunit